jgi:hypothetical protein
MGYLKEINVKHDMPAADDAVKRITFSIRSGRLMGASALKIIHGYGSTGRGGAIRQAARRYLEGQKRKGLIRDFIAGEDFSIFNKATLEAFKYCGDLRKDGDLDRHNNGITIVIL